MGKGLDNRLKEKDFRAVHNPGTKMGLKIAPGEFYVCTIPHIILCKYISLKSRRVLREKGKEEEKLLKKLLQSHFFPSDLPQSGKTPGCLDPFDLFCLSGI